MHDWGYYPGDEEFFGAARRRDQTCRCRTDQKGYKESWRTTSKETGRCPVCLRKTDTSNDKEATDAADH